VNAAGWERTRATKGFWVSVSLPLICLVLEERAAVGCAANPDNCPCWFCPKNCEAKACACGGKNCPKDNKGACHYCSRLNKTPPCRGYKQYCQCLTPCPTTCWGPYPRKDPWVRGCSPPRCVNGWQILPPSQEPCGGNQDKCDCDCGGVYSRCVCPNDVDAPCYWLYPFQGTAGCPCGAPGCKPRCTGGTIAGGGYWCGLCNAEKPAGALPWFKHMTADYGCGGKPPKDVCCKSCKGDPDHPVYAFGCEHEGKCFVHCLSKSYQLCLPERACTCPPENAPCHPTPGRGTCGTCDVLRTPGSPLKSCPNDTNGRCHKNGW